MKWSILGASSFTGSNFVTHLRRAGHHVQELGHPHLDINRNVGVLYTMIAGYQPDYIVNFISKSLVAESWGTPQEWVHTNTLSTTMLLEKIRTLPIRKYVHVSTPEVYGTGWHTEESLFRPSTPYAVSRAAMDMMLLAYHKAYGFPVVFTRSANVYGPGQTKRIIPIAISHKRAGTVLRLDGGGQSKRSFVHIRDVCKATELIAHEARLGHAYHIATPRMTSIRELVEMIGCQWAEAPERLGKDEEYLLVCAKLRLLGYDCGITLEEGIDELWKSSI